MGFFDRFKYAWNAFMNKDPTPRRIDDDVGYSFGYGGRPDRFRLTRGNERSIVASILNRMAVDCAAIGLEHVRLDGNGRYRETLITGLNRCLTLSANRDQTARAFLQDVYMSMFDEGCIAIVPTDADDDPRFSETFGIETLRVGKVVEWFPENVRIDVYNENTCRHEEIVLPKQAVAIVENPHYAIMNEFNSTLQRLIRKLNILDVIDEQSGSGKLDLIIQLPYPINTERRQRQAEERRKLIERQLDETKYGIAYTDATEHITQLNRAVENNMMGQIEYLTNMLYGQLGVTTAILDGTADEKTMLNYYNRTIEPVVGAVAEEMRRKFLSQAARTRGQSIVYFRDPFRLVPIEQIAEVADKFTRNEIMSSNEIRQLVGFKPVANEKADELRNKNLNPGENQTYTTTDGEDVTPEQETKVEERQLS